MSTISAADVNKLRLQTGAGMMDCKKALTEAGGDFDAAIELLRKKGAKIAANRADRESKEGAVIAKVNADGTVGVIVSLNCETDFVAKNEGFVALAHQFADIALQNQAADVNALKAMPIGSLTISDALTEQIGKIGEKIDINRYEILKGENVVAYIHGANRLGVLVSLNKPRTEATALAGKDVAMQIAAMNPLAVDKEGVDATLVQKEIEIGKELARQEGKPDAMLEKIAMGRLNKFYEENTLLNQVFVKDSSKKISQMLDETEKGLTVTAFKRVSLG